jgi:hypothetical protein
MKRSLALFAVMGAAAVGAGCAGAPREKPIKTTPIEQGTGTATQARNFLMGRWSLVSFEVYPPGAAPIAVPGNGTLNYDEFGNLAIEIRTDPTVAASLQAAGIPNDRGTLSSSGRVVVDMQNKKLTYVLEGQSQRAASTGPLAMSRPRYWQVDGDLLTLTTQDDAGKPTSVGRWKRVP